MRLLAECAMGAVVGVSIIGLVLIVHALMSIGLWALAVVPILLTMWFIGHVLLMGEDWSD